MLKMSSKTMLDFDEAMDGMKQNRAERSLRVLYKLYYVTKDSLIFEYELLLRLLHVLYIRKPRKYKFKCSPPT
jgi:hypothetical protein